VLRPAWFTDEKDSKDVETLEIYEENKLSTKDILIQHGLPSFINYNGDFKTNIAVLSVDSRIDNTDWIYHLQLMDKIIVFSQSEKQLLVSSGIDCDKVFNFDFPPLHMITKTHHLELPSSNTCFYTVGTLDTRSGLEEMLTAYLASFSVHDSVQFAVCTREDLSQSIQDKVSELKSSLGIYSLSEYYPNVVVINNSSNEIVNFLHQKGNFYVDAGYNYTPNQNLLRAIVHGSIPIVPETAAILGDDYDFYVETFEDVPVYPQRQIDHLWSAEFLWKKPKIASIMSCMKKAAFEKEEFERIQQGLAAFKQQLFTVPNNEIKGFLCIN